jgi:NADPH-dependent curcumin reductase CurA
VTLPASYQKLTVVKSSNTLRDAVDIQAVPMTPPGADEILVKTHYTGVNAADYLMAAGRYLSPTPPPFDLGAEATGEVVAVGANVKEFKVGDAVLAIMGGYREYFTLNARRAIPVPAATPEMVTLGVSGLTAVMALEKTGEMTSGETVLVTAAAGGTGSLAVQLAKLAGNHVIGTCGSADKAEFLRSIGCDRPINYREEKLSDVLKSEYPQGVNIVFECVGGKMFDTCVNALAVMGRLVMIGAISEYETGPEMVTNPRIYYKLLSKSASIRGFWLMHYFRHIGDYVPRLIQLLDEGKLLAAVDAQVFNGAEGALDAIEYMYQGKNTGKVVVKFS